MLRFTRRSTVKIASSHSEFGGSTNLFIELCVLFNKNGIPSEFYGPHKWHLDKCAYSKPNSELILEKKDYFIGHMLDLSNLEGYYPQAYEFFKEKTCRKSALSIHEKKGHLLRTQYLDIYDNIVFASENQKQWHAYYKGKQLLHIIPTPQAKLNKVKINKNNERVAGVIGSIDTRKQTHISILRALKDRIKKILIFGKITDQSYFDSAVKPLLSPNVIYIGEFPIEKKQEMYNLISSVYHSSTDESACLVQGECENTGLPFFGDCNTVPYEQWPEDKIISGWKKVLSYYY